MSDRIAKCDHCGALGRRRFFHSCPDHWFYLESECAGDGDIYVVWACSEACRDAIWKRGPGPREPGFDDDSERRKVERQNKLATAEARVAELEAALREALDIADEGWSYASDYFRDKHDSAGGIAECRRVLNAGKEGG